MMQRGDKDKDNQEEEQIYTYSGSEWHQGIIVCTPEDGNKHAESPVYNNFCKIFAQINSQPIITTIVLPVSFVCCGEPHGGVVPPPDRMTVVYILSFSLIIWVYSKV